MGVRMSRTRGCRRPVAESVRRVTAWALFVAALTTAQQGCSGYERFDDQADLRRRIAQRLGPRAGEVEIPFQLSAAVSEAFGGHLRPNPNENRRVEQVLEFVFGELHLRYSLLPTRDANGTFAAREGNCLSFVNLFVGLAREVRLNPFYVEVVDHQRWSYRDGQVLSQGHIVAGLMVQGKMRTFDFLPYRSKSYRSFAPIDDLTATAHYYNNLGAEALIEGNLPQARRWLELATTLAPDFVKASNNYGVLLTRLGDPEHAVAVYRAALTKAPEDVALLTNLAGLLLKRGERAEADQLLARVSGANNSNPFFFLYRAEAALSSGDTAEANLLLAEALRRDSELPEVHVGLVKLYLALGDVERARHHLGRALKLDATHAEARHYATMLDGLAKP
jgi:Tfp pilus assembly protein PilF